MLFRIEIAAYRDERVRFMIEKTLDKQPSFECLPLPPLGRDELTLGPGAARSATDFNLCRGSARREAREGEG
jgi:hypothetical protein